MDKNKTTPLHLTAKYGHEKTAKLLIDNKASLTQCNSSGHNALTIAILHGKRLSIRFINLKKDHIRCLLNCREVAETIIESEDWLLAMKSEFESPVTKVRETPLRLLIKQFPELAKKVFDRCMVTNLQSEGHQAAKEQFVRVSTEDPKFAITFNYELLDDAYCIYDDSDDRSSMKTDDMSIMNFSDPGRVNWAETEIWDDNCNLLPEAKPYSQSSTILKLNHPLMIMVEEKQTVTLKWKYCNGKMNCSFWNLESAGPPTLHGLGKTQVESLWSLCILCHSIAVPALCHLPHRVHCQHSSSIQSLTDPRVCWGWFK